VIGKKKCGNVDKLVDVVVQEIIRSLAGILNMNFLTSKE